MTVQAETITFDELSCGAYSALDVNVYQAKNLQLFGAYCAEGKQYPNTGFYTTSGNVIFSSQNGADFPPILAATNGSTFNLASISLASAAYTNVTALITVTLADGSVITQLVPITATQFVKVMIPISNAVQIRVAPFMWTWGSGSAIRNPLGNRFPRGYKATSGGQLGVVVWDQFEITRNTGVGLNIVATPGAGKATLTFDPPASNNPENPITGYRATCTPSTGGAPVTATGTGSPLVVQNLTNGETYNCTLTTLSEQGESAPSGAVSVTPQATVPAAPTGLTAKAAPSQVSLAFTAPTDNGGSPITGYEAICTPQGGGTPIIVTGPGSPLMVPGLTNDTTYHCTMSAVNAVGTGPASAPVAVTPRPVTAVPTLSEWCLLLLSAALGATALRRRRCG